MPAQTGGGESSLFIYSRTSNKIEKTDKTISFSPYLQSLKVIRAPP